MKYRHQKTLSDSKSTILTVQNSPDVSLKHSNLKKSKRESIVLNSNVLIPDSLNRNRWILPTSRNVTLNKDDDVQLSHIFYGQIKVL